MLLAVSCPPTALFVRTGAGARDCILRSDRDRGERLASSERAEVTAVLTVLFLVFLPSLLIGAALQVPRVCRTLARLARRCGLLAPPPQAAGIPIERIAADLRRLDDRLTALRGAGPVTAKAVKLTAAQGAYDDRLLDACRALDVRHDLDTARGAGRAVERLRIEAALVGAGLELRPATRH